MLGQTLCFCGNFWNWIMNVDWRHNELSINTTKWQFLRRDENLHKTSLIKPVLQLPFSEQQSEHFKHLKLVNQHLRISNCHTISMHPERLHIWKRGQPSWELIFSWNNKNWRSNTKNMSLLHYANQCCSKELKRKHFSDNSSPKAPVTQENKICIKWALPG